MRKILLSAIVIAAVPAEALAISRYQSTAMSCAQVQAAVRDEGAVILRYRSTRNPSLPLYGRYVSDDRFCKPGERIDFASVPSGDRASCPVYECKMFDPEDEMPWLRRH